MIDSTHSQEPHDPITTTCSRCGHLQFNDRIGPQPRCENCYGYMSYASEGQVALFYARMTEQIRLDEGYVAVA